MRYYFKFAMGCILAVLLFVCTACTSRDNGAALKREQSPDISKEDIRDFRVIVNGKTAWSIDYAPRQDRASYLYWDMKVPYESLVVVDTQEMLSVFERIALLDLTNGQGTSQYEDTGIKTSDTSITIDYYKEDRTGKMSGDGVLPNRMLTLIVGNKNGEGLYYCALKGAEDKILLLEASSIDAALYKAPYDLIIKIPYLADIDTVSTVNAACDNKKLELSLNGDTYRIDGTIADKQVYTSLYSCLMQPMISGEIPSTSKLPENRAPILTLKYIRSKKDAENYTVKFYEYDSDYNTVEVNGKEFFLVSKTDVEALKKIIIADR